MDFLNEILLFFAAVFPAIALCVYVFKKDRAEKEPIGLLLGLFALGALICFPAAMAEEAVLDAIVEVFKSFGRVEDGIVKLSSTAYTFYNIAENFVGIALVEEGLKFLVLYLVTKNNKNFNSLFDGLIYSVFVSLGFAALENVLYVTDSGFHLAIIRGVLSVPGHMFFAVIMGYYYSMWNLYGKANSLEKQCKSNGIIPQNAVEYKSGKYLALSLVMPILAHGFYDYCCTVDEVTATVALYVFVAFLYVYCFNKIRKMSKMDCYNNALVLGLLINKYPAITGYLVPDSAFNASDENSTNTDSDLTDF